MQTGRRARAGDDRGRGAIDGRRSDPAGGGVDPLRLDAVRRGARRDVGLVVVLLAIALVALVAVHLVPQDRAARLPTDVVRVVVLLGAVAVMVWAWRRLDARSSAVASRVRHEPRGRDRRTSLEKAVLRWPRHRPLDPETLPLTVPAAVAIVDRSRARALFASASAVVVASGPVGTTGSPLDIATAAFEAVIALAMAIGCAVLLVRVGRASSFLARASASPRAATERTV